MVRGDMFTGLAGTVIGVGSVLFGCSATEMPSRIGKYHLDEDARHTIHTYLSRTVERGFYEVTERVFTLTDTNEDLIIDSEEAYDSINVIRPHIRKLYNELISLNKEELAKEAIAENSKDKKPVIQH